jgi:8-oxo-dGTP diphosphatase
MSNQSILRDPLSYSVRRAVKALITAGDRLLLVEETHDDGTPFWTLPGGGVRPHESDRQALERELAEELRCGIEVRGRESSVWYAHSSNERLSLYIVYSGTLTSRPEPNLAEGIRNCRLVKPGDFSASTLQQVRYLCGDIGYL